MLLADAAALLAEHPVAAQTCDSSGEEGDRGDERVADGALSDGRACGERVGGGTDHDGGGRAGGRDAAPGAARGTPESVSGLVRHGAGGGFGGRGDQVGSGPGDVRPVPAPADLDIRGGLLGNGGGVGVDPPGTGAIEQVRARRSAGSAGRPPGAQPPEAELLVQIAACEPDFPPGRDRLSQVGQADGVPCGPAGLVRVGPQDDQQAGVVQAGEELFLGAGGPGGRQHLAGQDRAGGMLAHGPARQAARAAGPASAEPGQ